LNIVLGLFSDDLGERLGCFRGAVAIRPDSSSALVNLGVALRNKKNVDGAIACFNKALECDPTSAAAHNNLGLVLYEKQNRDGAIACYKKALECDPKYSKAHYNLGLALYQSEKPDLDGAIDCYRKALQSDPKDARAHTNLGLALLDKKDVAGAIACFNKALKHDPKLPNAHIGLGQAQLAQGQFAEAKQAFTRAVQCLPPGDPLLDYLQNRLWHCQNLLAMDQKLTAVLQGQTQPASALEYLVLGKMCVEFKQRYAAAVKLFAAGFAAQPALADDLTKAIRYHAARTAALAAAGKGRDADTVDSPGKSKLRLQALEWLKADLELWQRQAKSKEPKVLQTVVKSLTNWQTEPDLASVRDETALAQLPPAERQDWQQLWSDVAQLLQQAKK
jgi:tetratricopeptide (TPR) repeat protein